MSVALTAPAQANVGNTILVTATGFTNSGAIKVAVSEEGGEGVSVIGYFNAASDGTFTTAANLEVVASRAGNLDYTFTDVTANTKTTVKVRIFED